MSSSNIKFVEGLDIDQISNLPGHLKTITPAFRLPISFFIEFFLLVLFAFSNNLAYYIVNREMSVLITGVVLSFLMIILLLSYYIIESNNNKYCERFFYPALCFTSGLCFIFEDPDALRVFMTINSDPSYLSSLLTLILLMIISNQKEIINISLSYANLVIGILSFCLIVAQKELIAQAVYLFIALIGIFVINIQQKFLNRTKVNDIRIRGLDDDKEPDLEFEDITTKLVVTADMLTSLLAKPEPQSEVLHVCIKNIRLVSQCLQKKNNIYTVKVNSVTRNLDEQDKVFIEQSCFDGQLKGGDFSSNHFIKPEDELAYGVSELLGLLKNIGRDWNFNTFFLADCCNNTPLQVAGLFAFRNYNLDEVFKIPENSLKTFLKNLELTYKANPYHNSIHAADVMSSQLYLIKNSQLLNVTTNLDIMASIIATLGHDAGHPAKNNRFLVMTKHELAIQYNDISVLEMLHTSIVFQIIMKPESNIFVNLTSDQWNIARKMIIEMILATDMSKHFDLLGQFRGKYKSPEAFELEKVDMKTELFRLIIKAADIGHAAKVIELHEKWCRLVVEEFYSQGDLEKQQGLAVSMYCDRETTDISKSQAGFIKNIVLPLFTAINFVLASDNIEQFCVEQLKVNELFWLQRRKNIRGRSLIVKEGEYVNHLSNLGHARGTIRKPSLPNKYLT